MKKYLYPPTENKIKPALEIVKKIWIDAYVDIAGQEFMKKVAPRQISIAGGYNVNEDGSVTLGFADSGKKIILQIIRKSHLLVTPLLGIMLRIVMP